ncbi:ubiquinone_biosynthesis_monooxygenase_COQ6 [Candidozyma auris]|uniref:ubiquinone_biosynthesis_monooxygenase_COQ6 n=1 Tax=Candidozyma auris TaxID=498019 RepID=UPI000D2BA553|nr:ubiquinone_biosynthesis_monooxygenase_COQ6 [[Candida] auris]QEO22263.1 ubiquinone_biosynthesis_monooxygenase_COQ6 [[Candida] auris]GBL51326.1 ubiquinone biosynthesis monooxygenase COQ6 [[Candida] auris]
MARFFNPPNYYPLAPYLSSPPASDIFTSTSHMPSVLRLVRGLATNAKPKLQDIVIVGGGPAGLSLLSALKNNAATKHLQCTLIEGSSFDGVRKFAQDPPETYTNRVVSLTPKSVEFMSTKSGSWDHIQTDRVKFYDHMIAYDSQDPDARIEFDTSQVSGGGGVIAAMAEVVNIQGSLLEKIDELNEELAPEYQANIVEKARVVDIKEGKGDLDWPVVALDNGETYQTRLLVGADGQNSPVRKYAGIESRGWPYNRFGVVGTLKVQYEDYRAIAWQRFLTTGPLAILPLTEDNVTFVWSSTPELADTLMKVDEEIFPHLINAALVLEEVDLNYIYKMLRANPSDKQAIEEIQWRLSKIPDEELEEKYPVPVARLMSGSRARFPLKLLHADTYTAPRVALVGDAAHTVHPLAGQGLNMGQSDVAALVETIETGISRGQDIGSKLTLDYYTAKAWPANHVLMGICDKLHKIFSTDFSPLVFVRGFGLKSINMLGSIKDMMISSVSGR